MAVTGRCPWLPLLPHCRRIAVGPPPAGKVEVIEFFWYSCPHCNAFEPTLEAWVKKLPSDVVFTRVPVMWGNPQLTGLAMSLGAIFNGTVITEIVFGYPGVGTLLINAVHAGDYSLVLGLASLSIIGVAIAVFLIDILSPLLDPRIKAE